MLTKCPDFENAWKLLIEDQPDLELSDLQRRCDGKWITGSGGHRRHSKKWCENVVTWWHYDSSYAYCDEHIPERDKKEYLEDWILTLKGYR